MSYPEPALSDLLTHLGSTIRDLCQRQIDKHRPLENLNLPSIVDRVLHEHGADADFDEQLMACISFMCHEGATGQTLVFEREKGKLNMREIDTSDLVDTSIDSYEMVLFDGGNIDGDCWKHVFFPRQRTHYFVYEA